MIGLHVIKTIILKKLYIDTSFKYNIKKYFITENSINSLIEFKMQL